MTTASDEGSFGNGRCGIPGCRRPADGLLCDEHKAGAPPERLERIAHRCNVMTEDGTPCQVFTLHERCHKHRRQRAGDEGEL